MSPLALGFIYYCVLVPLGLARRAFVVAWAKLTGRPVPPS